MSQTFLNGAVRRWVSFAIAAAFLVILPQLFVESETHARVITIAGICLLLWITEIVPPFVPTLLLWTAIPLFLAPIDPRFTLPNVLSWAADPVMALFFGGFALGVATDRSGLGISLTRLALGVGMLIASYLFLAWRARRAGMDWKAQAPSNSNDETKQDEAFPHRAFLVVLIGTAVLWLTEPLHHIPASVIALGSAGMLFLSRILSRKDLVRIDWSTLLLIGGGITLGKLLEQSALVSSLASKVPFGELHPTISLFILCISAATLSALTSNTATVVLLIPLATAFMPSPSTAVLVAISASFGVPLLISTPPNAMAFGHGGVKFGDLFWPGIVLMLGGCVLIALTGRQVLNFAGIP